MKQNLFRTGTLLALLLLSIVALTVQVAALPVSVEWIKINGDIVESGERLEVERSQILDVKVKFTALADAENIRAEAFIQGYEHRLIIDETPIFDITQGNTYTKSLKIKLPDEMDRDDYVLRVIMSDRTGPLSTFQLALDVSTARHSLSIDDVSLSPGSTVEAGRSLLTTVRLDNMGQKDEDVKVTVSMPELSISQVDYVDQLESDDARTSEELFLRIPRCAKPGEYTLVVKVEYNEMNSVVTSQKTITVVEGEFCDELSNMDARTKIVLGNTVQTLAAGEKGIYPVTITNQARESKTYALLVEGAGEFGEIQVSPSNVMQLDGGESGTAFIFVRPNADASGDKQFVLTVQEDGSILKQLTLSASVKDNGSWSGLAKGLQIAVIVLVVVLVVLGLFIGFSRLRENGEFKESQGGEEKDFY